MGSEPLAVPQPGSPPVPVPRVPRVPVPEPAPESDPATEAPLAMRSVARAEASGERAPRIPALPSRPTAEDTEHATRLAVLIDRGGRELPIAPDVVGKKTEVPNGQRVDVLIEELDGRDAVVLA